jgi:integrase
MVGLAILSGLRRGELFALRWRDIDEESRVRMVREAVYDGIFDTPKTEAEWRQIPLSDGALGFIRDWKQRAVDTAPGALVFSTGSGHTLSPNTCSGERSSPHVRAWACRKQHG